MQSLPWSQGHQQFRGTVMQSQVVCVCHRLCDPLIMTLIVVTTLVSVSSWFLAIDMMESASKTIVGDSGNKLPRRRRREGGVGGEGRVCTFVQLAIGVMTTLKNTLQKHCGCLQVVYLGCNSWKYSVLSRSTTREKTVPVTCYVITVAWFKSGLLPCPVHIYGVMII